MHERHMEDLANSGLDPPSSEKVIAEIIKTYWKRQKQDQAAQLLDTEELKKRFDDFFKSVKEIKFGFSKDEASKRPHSGGKTNPKHFKKSCRGSPENFRGGRESPPAVQPCHSSSKRRPNSSDSSIRESPIRNGFPEGFDLRSILQRKSSTSQDCNRDNRSESYKYLVHERSSSFETDNAHQISRRKPRSQRRSSNRSSCRSCCCRSYDSFSSSENESFHSANHEGHHSRYHRSRSYRRKRSCSRYPDRKKSKHLHRSPSSTTRIPIDLAHEPHSSRSQPPLPSDYYDHYNPVQGNREPYFAQNYAGDHTGYNRDRSSSLKHFSFSDEDVVQKKYFDEDSASKIRQHKTKKVKCSSSAKKRKSPIDEMRRSPTLDRGSSRRYSFKEDVPKRTLDTGYNRDRSSSLNHWSSPYVDVVRKKYFDEDSASKIGQHKTKKVKYSSSAKKRKSPIDEMWRSPTLHRGSSRRQSCKEDAPKKTLEGEPRENKLNKEKCPVDKEYNKRMHEEFLKTNWITSNDESNSIAGSPRVSSSVVAKKDPVRQEESQDSYLQEIEVMIKKCRAKLTEESESSVEKNPIVLISDETDLFAECVVPKVAFDKKGVTNEKYEREESRAPDITFVEREFSNNEQHELSEAPEVVFIEEKKVANERNTYEESKAPLVPFVEGEVSNKDQCEEFESSEVTFVEKVLNGSIQCEESEAPEVIFVQCGVLNEKDQCEESEVSMLTLVEESTKEEDQLRKSEAPKITSEGKDLFSNTVSLPEGPPAIQDYLNEERKPILSNFFFCNLCQIQLTSEVTFRTHMVGKKHRKKLESVCNKVSLPVSATPSVTLNDTPRFDQPPPGKKRRLTRRVARLQSTIDEIIDKPVAGLEYVHEIISPSDVGYYCSLCDAPCQAVSIMPHLIGIRHQLKVARELFPDYDLDGDQHDQALRRYVEHILRKYEKRYGRGAIQVFREEDDPDTDPVGTQAGPSNRYPTIPRIKKEPNDDIQELPPRDACLDMSKGDFFCLICDAHMNNPKMWEQHLRGRRHLSNIKKVPGESISKFRSEKLPGVVSNLDKIIHKKAEHELIVGLDYIRETRGPAGEIYNCFLCGACCTSYDIVEHLLLLKHRAKYLEQLNFEGKSDAIKEIDMLEFKETHRESLIIYECYKMVEDFGRGQVEVYKTKNCPP